MRGHRSAAALIAREAALRRVATLVAQGADPEAVFAAVAEEVARLLSADTGGIQRFEADGDVTLVGVWGAMTGKSPVGSRMRLDGDSLAAIVRRTQQAARFDSYADTPGEVAAAARTAGVRSAVGSPIFVAGCLWGVVIAGTTGATPMPADVGSQLTEFTDLVATAISNVEAQADVRRLAAEQAALRQVATLIARERPPDEVFATVAEEVGQLLGAATTGVWRYDPEGTGTLVGSWGLDDDQLIGRSVPLEGDSVAAVVQRTGKPARVGYDGSPGVIAEYARGVGLRSGVGAPIVAGGRLWGTIVVTTSGDEAMPADAESRLTEFTDLVATAISNIQAREDLNASRARIVAAADNERRRVVRDLHDGAQQRMVHTVVTLRLAQQAIEQGEADVGALVDEALEQAQQSTQDLRDLAHGILPAVLTRGGLRAAVGTVVARITLPVELEVPLDRFPAEIEATAYFIVAEALTNVVKHAGATHAEVRACVEDGRLLVEVRDDGAGGADARGHGLVGVRDRASALGGTLTIESPEGGGTLVAAALPLPPPSA